MDSDTETLENCPEKNKIKKFGSGYVEIEKKEFDGIVKAFRPYLKKIDRCYMLESCSDAFLIEFCGKYYVNLP